MPLCPKCHSASLRRSATRSRWERWRKEITGKRPYRCRACRWRGWKRIGIVEEDVVPSHGRASEAPNLKGTALARLDPRTDLDIKELDKFHTSGKDDA